MSGFRWWPLVLACHRWLSAIPCLRASMDRDGTRAPHTSSFHRENHMTAHRILPARNARAVLAAIAAIGSGACTEGASAPPTTGSRGVALAGSELTLAAAPGDCSNLVAPLGAAGGGPAGYTLCTSEGGSCSFNQTVDVAFGASGGFAYKDGVTGTVTFNAASFGVDPAVNVVKAGYYRISGGPPGYTKCADEGGT